MTSRTCRPASSGQRSSSPGPAGSDVARRLRDLIDDGFREKVTFRQAAETIHAHPAHLVRMFSREFGISPHQYLTGQRVDLARGLLLDGMPASLAAAAAGFCDQSHLSRSFRKLLGTSPGRYTGGKWAPGGRRDPGPPGSR